MSRTSHDPLARIAYRARSSSSHHPWADPDFEDLAVLAHEPNGLIEFLDDQRIASHNDRRVERALASTHDFPLAETNVAIRHRGRAGRRIDDVMHALRPHVPTRRCSNWPARRGGWPRPGPRRHPMSRIRRR